MRWSMRVKRRHFSRFLAIRVSGVPSSLSAVYIRSFVDGKTSSFCKLNSSACISLRYKVFVFYFCCYFFLSSCFFDFVCVSFFGFGLIFLGLVLFGLCEMDLGSEQMMRIVSFECWYSVKLFKPSFLKLMLTQNPQLTVSFIVNLFNYLIFIFFFLLISPSIYLELELS